MDDRALWRAGGWAAILGGTLLVVHFAAGLLAPQESFEPVRLAGLPHEVWHIPLMVGVVLTLFGVFAVYLRQAGQVGRLGFVGFVLLVVGLAVGVLFSAIFTGVFLPDLARYIPPEDLETILTDPTPAQVARGVIVQVVGLGLGAILFGVATIRARVLPTAGGWLLIAGALLSAASELALILRALGALSFAVAFIVLGVAVRRSAAVSTSASPAAEPGP